MTSPQGTLLVTTRRLEDAGDVRGFFDSDSPLYFRRGGRTLVGIGSAVKATFKGDDRFSASATWWKDVLRRAHVSDSINAPGTGLVAFAQFTFSSSSAIRSVVTIPRIVIGSDAHGVWLTTIGAEEQPTPRETSEASSSPVTWSHSSDEAESFTQNVRAALEKVNSGVLHKVVLARQIVGTSNSPIDPRQLTSGLESAYPDTHIFALGGLVGASPETLASVRGGTLSATVLAGSTGRGVNPDDDQRHAEELAQSAKDLDEHEYAVSSAVQSLEQSGFGPVVADEPRALKLKNLWHLATDIKSEVPTGLTAFDVLGTLHPTAAVAGTPTEAALSLIDELEPFDRGFFGGPVGWCDSQGNAEFAIALRCAQLSDNRKTITAHAGAGIVADSIPEKELLETDLKFLPIIDACTN